MLYAGTDRNITFKCTYYCDMLKAEKRRLVKNAKKKSGTLLLLFATRLEKSTRIIS